MQANESLSILIYICFVQLYETVKMQTKFAVLSIFLMGSAGSIWAGDECEVYEKMFDAPSAEVEKDPNYLMCMEKWHQGVAEQEEGASKFNHPPVDGLSVDGDKGPLI